MAQIGVDIPLGPAGIQDGEEEGQALPNQSPHAMINPTQISTYAQYYINAIHVPAHSNEELILQ